MTQAGRVRHQLMTRPHGQCHQGGPSVFYIQHHVITSNMTLQKVRRSTLLVTGLHRSSVAIFYSHLSEGFLFRLFPRRAPRCARVCVVIPSHLGASLYLLVYVDVRAGSHGREFIIDAPLYFFLFAWHSFHVSSTVIA